MVGLAFMSFVSVQASSDSNQKDSEVLIRNFASRCMVQNPSPLLSGVKGSVPSELIRTQTQSPLLPAKDRSILKSPTLFFGTEEVCMNKADGIASTISDSPISIVLRNVRSPLFRAFSPKRPTISKDKYNEINSAVNLIIQRSLKRGSFSYDGKDLQDIVALTTDLKCSALGSNCPQISYLKKIYDRLCVNKRVTVCYYNETIGEELKPSRGVQEAEFYYNKSRLEPVIVVKSDQASPEGHLIPLMKLIRKLKAANNKK